MVLFFRRTISPILKCLLIFCHLALLCRVPKTFFRNRHQNSSAICWILLQRQRLYKSGFLKSAGGGKTTLDFVVSRLIGLSATSLPTSPKVSTVKGLEYTDSTSVNSVIGDSSFKLVPCCFSNADSITRADFIWRSQTPPMWLAERGMFFHVTQSVSPFCRKCDILSWPFSERDLWSSHLAPRKLIPM